MSIGTVALAGCGGDDGASADENVTATGVAAVDATASVPYEAFPDSETLLEGHAAALADRTYTAAEYTEQLSSSGESVVRETTLRSADAGALLEGDDVARNYGSDSSQSVWFTDNARISRVTHRYNPDGVTLPSVDESFVETLGEIAAFERAEVADDESAAVAFEASGLSESARDDRTDFRSIEIRVAITAARYIHSIDAEITFAQSADAEETQTAIYRYTVSDVGETSASAPEFVDEAFRVHGDVADDGSAVVLEHTGGPAVEAGTPILFQDADAFTPEYNQPTFPSTFSEGDVAYVYWTGEDEAAIAAGGAPETVARDIALPSEDGNSGVYVEEHGTVGPARFEVRIDRRA